MYQWVMNPKIFQPLVLLKQRIGKIVFTKHLFGRCPKIGANLKIEPITIHPQLGGIETIKQKTMTTKLTDKGVKLALKLNKLVHNRCKDVPHDIGLQLIDIVIQHTRWISVSEKLPPKNELVSVRNDDCVPPYSHAKYLGKGKWLSAYCDRNLYPNPTHWKLIDEW